MISKNLVYLPNISLLTYKLEDAKRVNSKELEIVFLVSKKVNKPIISSYLKSVYGMEVTMVRIVNTPHKIYRSNKGWYKKPSRKKAIVRIRA